jgi:hypothetical protein
VGDLSVILLFVSEQTPSPALPLTEGKGARRVERGVYIVKMVDTLKMIDFAITSCHFFAS